ncbi:MAG TPA: ferrous iron transporter B [Phycisphaerales bacterium]|nr:ferrous iron transporter B [Phycisphaerales bacterium]
MSEKVVQLEVSAPPADAPQSEREAHPGRAPVVRIALLGNPNTGKTTLFNRISGLRHKTSNFPGTTLEARVVRVKAGVEGGRDGDLIDLPGIYSIELDQLESRVCREVLAGTAAPQGEPLGVPEVVVVVVDATNLGRNLMLVGEVMRRRLPMVVVVNMLDLAARQQLAVDLAALGQALGCEVVGTNARSGEGIDDVRRAIRRARIATPALPLPTELDTLRAWADQMYLKGAREPEPLFGLKESFSDRVDKILLHPVSGLLAFALIMGGLFWTIFSLAKFPMDWIIEGFDLLSSFITAHLPEGILTDLLSNGVVAGVGSTLVFLPQICLLFFLISLLEDTGYLARASFLMDRLLRPFGLPGNAFVPLLSSHACALPGILATRGIPDLKQRLTTILVAPFMTCSARLPVYVLLTSLLFADRPAMAALAFVGCYALGMIAGVLSALVARRTILRGPARPMAMELPSYKRPSVRTAAMTTIDRAWVFLKNAGTVILAISVLMWWLGEYPKAEPPKQAVELRERAAALDPEGTVDHVMLVDPASGRRVEVSPPAMRAEADHLESINQKTHSFMGRIGRTVQPVFSPMDWDWRVCIGVMASFAAREVFVATMSVVVAGEDNDDVGDRSLIDSMRTATRDDGRTPIFTPKVCWSLLVFYVLAMQCLATLALTARETGAGGWKWALLQFGWMSALAYLAAFITATVVG